MSDAPKTIWALADRRKHWQDEPPQDGQHEWHWHQYTLTASVAVRLKAADELEKAMVQCCEEIDAYIQHEYPHDHPVQERCRQRDYAANPARIALTAYRATKEIPE